MTKAATTLTIDPEFASEFMSLIAPVSGAALSSDFNQTPAPSSPGKGQALLFNVET